MGGITIKKLKKKIISGIIFSCLPLFLFFFLFIGLFGGGGTAATFNSEESKELANEYAAIIKKLDLKLSWDILMLTNMVLQGDGTEQTALETILEFCYIEDTEGEKKEEDIKKYIGCKQILKYLELDQIPDKEEDILEKLEDKKVKLSGNSNYKETLERLKVSEENIKNILSVNKEKYLADLYEMDNTETASINLPEIGIDNTNNTILEDTNVSPNIKINKMIELAKTKIGNRYVYGGTSIDGGIDCSAFVQWCYRQIGVMIGRDSRTQCSTNGKEVAYSSILPGDLLFYTNEYGVVSHVTMYIGNGVVIHASNSAPYPKGGIKLSAVTYRRPYKVKRIVE